MLLSSLLHSHIHTFMWSVCVLLFTFTSQCASPEMEQCPTKQQTTYCFWALTVAEYTTPLALVVLWPAPLPPDVTFVCSDVALITWVGDKVGQHRSRGTAGQFGGKIKVPSFLLIPPSLTLQTCFHSDFSASQQVLNTAACTLELSTVLKKHGAL